MGEKSYGFGPETGQFNMMREGFKKKLNQALENFGRTDIDAEDVMKHMTDDEVRAFPTMDEKGQAQLHQNLMERALPEETAATRGEDKSQAA